MELEFNIINVLDTLNFFTKFVMGFSIFMFVLTTFVEVGGKDYKGTVSDDGKKSLTFWVNIFIWSLIILMIISATNLSDIKDKKEAQEQCNQAIIIKN
jgi:uncharacterized transporter YbjL